MAELSVIAAVQKQFTTKNSPDFIAAS